MFKVMAPLIGGVILIRILLNNYEDFAIELVQLAFVVWYLYRLRKE